MESNELKKRCFSDGCNDCIYKLNSESNPANIDKEIIDEWQRFVNLLSDFINVPTGLITRIGNNEIEVVVSSQTKSNPYKPGLREPLKGSNLYCEEVTSKKAKLHVQNAFKEDRWYINPDIKHGMISYLGYPVFYPDGDVFGTICVLDNKENNYSNRAERLLIEFKEQMQNHLKYLCQSRALISARNELHNVEDSLSRKVNDRAVELEEVNKQLTAKTKKLEEKNIALKQVLDQFNSNRNEIINQIKSNIEKISLPIISKLATDNSTETQRNISLLKRSLEELSSPFLSNLESKFHKLSVKEIQICNLIRNSMSTKEIAFYLNSSPETVRKQRISIRKKLGITNKSINLEAFLKEFKK